MKPIETHYKGYRFRSRIEARWAVFFDSLGLEWEYELEGYVLPDDTPYLPDFWLPQVDMWAEVKSHEFTLAEVQKCSMLVNLTGKCCLLLSGIPSSKSYIRLMGDTLSNKSELLGEFCIMWHKIYYTDDVILSTENLYPFDEGRFFNSTGCGCAWEGGTGCQDCRREDTDLAAITARSARFEHGESPLFAHHK